MALELAAVQGTRGGPAENLSSADTLSEPLRASAHVSASTRPFQSGVRKQTYGD
jgi:hypothetical protein